MALLFAALGLFVLVALLSAMGYRAMLKIEHPIQYEKIVNAYAEEYGVETWLIYAVIKTESSFHPEAESAAGAQGLMQITPDTFDWLRMKLREETPESAIFEPDTAIRYGTYFLKLLLDEFQDPRVALAAYHAGRGRVNGWLADESVSPDGKTLPEIPSRDTAHYVNKVMKAWAVYQNLYG